MRRLAGIIFIDFRVLTELVVAAMLLVVFMVATDASNFDETLDKQTRAALYGSAASSSGALLGFSLTALAILVALPSTERINQLQEHPRWRRVPESYFRAARMLLAVLVLTSLGIALDSAKRPWLLYEGVVVLTLAFGVVRVTSAVVALDSVIAVARSREPKRRAIEDPGP